MKEYKRLTEKDGATRVMSQWAETSNDLKIYRRLAELEDKIENGTLVELPCKCTEELDIIKKGMIFIFYKMCLEQKLGQGVFLKYKSKINEWFNRRSRNDE